MTGLSRVLAFGMLLALCACSFSDEAMMPSLFGSGSVGDSGLALGTSTFVPPGVTPGRSTGTAVGDRVDELRDQLKTLQSQIIDENNKLQTLRQTSRQGAAAYHELKGRMNARLTVGTTPGNPELVKDWRQAQKELSQVDSSINSMNALSNEVDGSATLGAYLLQAIPATLRISGAVDEDHRQLAVLEDETNQTVVLVDRLQSELSEDVARQSAYLSTERANLTATSVAIKNGEYVGVSLANRAYGVPPPPPPQGAAPLVGRVRPLVVIRFDRQNVDYEPALFSAVSAALERKPNAGFDLVAVAPGSGPAGEVNLAAQTTRQNAEKVLRSLTNMGLPADRVSLSSVTNPSATVGEVHVYVR
ncbi:hypothetical protein SAMN06265365_101606 [Tistlia consotensis]|uniref:Uncharacterized protein n=1 Tax=Tistlia consotensis USBA 355 TaxID=560819 RepID=A0A1Y6BA60_9PROT|nr:hypothetical protein [Tistlia consotensis]SME93754.1 hypothetical protein SAMN05428998_101605 [Tistlia consotensis USBA 355]SNR28786.1 hypothetical protein SAMN06265365_101606 [Tistlia consotensis]